MRLRGSPVSPAGLLRALPSELGLDARELGPLPSNPAKGHFLYGAGRRRMLHLYVNPSRRLARALGDREQIRLGAPDGSVPRLDAAVGGRDCVWVLEERLGGDPPTGPPAVWFPGVADWAVGLAGPPGPPLADSALWSSQRLDAAAAVPAAFREPVERALEAVGRLPARHMHGDLQPTNVVITADGTGAIDWEGAWLRGVPGLDLLFLALVARPGPPAAEVLTALATGRDPTGTPLRDPLSRLGVGQQELPAVLATSMAIWTLAERRRLARLGRPPAPPAFRALWEQAGPLLADRL